MNQPSPCPQCRSDRVWARAALGAYGITHVAFCPGCARAATLCGRCGGELVLIRQSSWAASGRPHIETVLQCPTCRQTAASVPHAGRQATPAGPTAAPPRAGQASMSAAAPAMERSAIRRFAVEAPPAGVVQRVADDFEQAATSRYVRHRRLAVLIDEAARRADSLARLESELSRLETQDRLD
jgi:hypothetical protein